MLDFLRSLLFESLWLLLAAEAIALAVAVAFHRRRLTRRSARIAWITAAVCALMVLVQTLVVTDQEALESTVTELARAVDQGDMDALNQLIDDRFATRGWNKADLLQHSNATLQQWQVDAPSVGAFKIEVEGTSATVSFRAFCDLRSNEVVQYNALSRWRIRCERHPDGWKLREILVAKLGPADLSGQGGIDILNQLR